MNHTNGSYRSNGTQAGYPRRLPYFANRFICYVFRAGLAMDLGAQAALLLIVVVQTEDKTRYRKPVRFWNDNLTAYLGCREDRLCEIRKRLVEAGWLHYEPGRKGIAGQYWVLIPGGESKLDDSVLGANFPPEIPEGKPEGNGNGIEIPSTFPPGNPEEKPGDNAWDNTGDKPEPFYLSPKPIPEERRESTGDGRPSLEKLQELVIAWNALPDVPKVAKLTDGRKQTLRARLQDPTFADRWRDAMGHIGSSSFCRGANDRGWRADFDWFLKPDTVTKILEGKYDDRTNSNQRRHPSQARRTPPNASDAGGSVASMYREKYDGDVAAGVATAAAD